MAVSRLPGEHSGNGDESRLRELEKNNAILMAWLVQNQRDSKELVKNYEEQAESYQILVNNYDKLVVDLPEAVKDIVGREIKTLEELIQQLKQLLRKGGSMSATETTLPPESQKQWDTMTTGVDPLTQDLAAQQVLELPHEPEAMAGAWNSLLERSEDLVVIQALYVVFETTQRLVAFIAELRAQVQSKEDTCGKAAGFIQGLQARIQQLEKK